MPFTIKTSLIVRLALALFIVSFASAGRGATTIDAVNRHAYGENFGWLDAYADGTNGAVIGEFYCLGNLYSANVGWINLGSGHPTNGIAYQNSSATDFGVNQDGRGNLRGYAYGANIGWINFENTGAPKVDLRTGKLSGYVWSANCGWISLNNTVAYVQTDSLWPGPLAPNGLPIPWLLTYFGSTNASASSDLTGKGMSLGQDYVAGTNPTNASSVLRITAATVTTGGTNVSLAWASVPTRLYYLQKSVNLSTNAWIDSGLGLISPSSEPTTSDSFTDTNAPVRFYRVQAVVPLSP